MPIWIVITQGNDPKCKIVFDSTISLSSAQSKPGETLGRRVTGLRGLERIYLQVYVSRAARNSSFRLLAVFYWANAWKRKTNKVEYALNTYIDMTN